MSNLSRPYAAPCGPAKGARHSVERARNRIIVGAALFVVAFAVLAIRLGELTLLRHDAEPAIARGGAAHGYAAERADMTDRNGVLLATSLGTASLYADARLVIDADEAAAKLVKVLPDLDRDDVKAKLTSGRGFVWLKRNLTPRQHHEVNRLGIPGLDFKREERRVYPTGALAGHVLGYTDVDGRGIAGTEMAFDDALRNRKVPVALSIDTRIQNVLAEELHRAMAAFSAIGASGIVMDVRTGELLAMASLPAFDPNKPGAADPDTMFNRAALGVYEMGSVFKIFTVAMALDSGTARLDSGYDASAPLKVSRFTIRDYHGKNRWLTVAEIFQHSSNIGAARMALDVGGAGQRAFLKKLGLLSAAPIELPEVGLPLAPDPWREINTMTIGFGHGVSVTPVQMAAAAAAMVNGGIYYRPTLARRAEGDPPAGRRVISARTSAEMRELMRLVVASGTGKQADAPGYRVGGKTGTAEKVNGRTYKARSLLSSFVGAFPIEDPRYLVLAIVDEPRGTKESHGFATGGWVAAPVVRRVVERMAPLVGIAPSEPPSPQLPPSLRVEVRERVPGGRGVASN